MNYQPRFRNLLQLFTQSVEKFGNRRFLGTRKPDGWHWTTFTQFAELAAAGDASLRGVAVSREVGRCGIRFAATLG